MDLVTDATGVDAPGADAQCQEPDPGIEDTEGRTLEVVFLDITETWRGRRVSLWVWEPAHAQIPVEVAPSVLCEVPRGGLRAGLRDDMGRAVWGANDLRVAPSDASIEIRLPAGCRVQGTIVTADRLPFVGKVCVRWDHSFAKTDAQGAFDAGFVLAGRHPVEVSDGTRASVTIGHIEVAGGGTMQADIVIPGSGSLAGEVDWQPREGLDLFVGVFRPGAKEEIAFVFPGPRPFRVNYLEAGAYELRSEAFSAPVGFEIQAGQCADVGKIPLLPTTEWQWGNRQPRD